MAMSTIERVQGNMKLPGSEQGIQILILPAIILFQLMIQLQFRMAPKGFSFYREIINFKQNYKQGTC